MSDDVDPRIANARPGWALVVLAAPLVAVVVVVVLYVGMVRLGLQGRAAGGGEVVLMVRTCEEALPVLLARLDDAGLPSTSEPVEGGWHVRTQGTGRDDVDAALPGALAQRGDFALRAADGVLFGNQAVTEATYRLDGMMDMWLLLRLDEEASEAVVDAVRAEPRGRMTFVLDGVDIAMQPNGRAVQRGEVEGIPLAEIDQKTRMRLIAEWSMLIDHPLPCDATVEVVQPRP